MKLLLTSGGITNSSIENTLVDLLGKPIAESSALVIPTALYGHPMAGPGRAWDLINGQNDPGRMCALGWKSLGVLELTALPSLPKEQWLRWVQETDALLVGGGDSLYLAYWMQQSGLVELFPSMHEKVYVGLSAGSMVMTPNIGEWFVIWQPPGGDIEPLSALPQHRQKIDKALGVVDFSIFPHVDHEGMAGNEMAYAEKWAASLTAPSYALDDESAIKVVDGTVEVISEGHWKRFEI